MIRTNVDPIPPPTSGTRSTPVGWYKVGQLLSKAKTDPTGGAFTGFKHGRVDRSKRPRK